MMRVLFVTNIPSPYRVAFFNELGKSCELYVCYERRSATDRSSKWKAEEPESFHEIYADVKPVGSEKSIGRGIVRVLAENKFDRLIICGYSSPSVMLAVAYCRRRRIPYYIESDGAFYKKDSFLKKPLKRFLLLGAVGHFTTCDEHIKYLSCLGVSRDRIIKYPFSSVKQEDILKSVLSDEEKAQLRCRLGLSGEKIVLSVGRFLHSKGFDVLLEAACVGMKNAEIYIVGGKPNEEYLRLREKYSLRRVHFVDFMCKEELALWYRAADCFVFPTRRDTWGLVVNEAMANGLPVVTTDGCIAGKELVRDGQNGFIVPVEDSEQLAEKTDCILNGSSVRQMGEQSLEIIRDYTIENMARLHLAALSSES